MEKKSLMPAVTVLAVIGVIFVFWLGYTTSQNVMHMDEAAGFRLPPGDEEAGKPLLIFSVDPALGQCLFQLVDFRVHVDQRIRIAGVEVPPVRLVRQHFEGFFVEHNALRNQDPLSGQPGSRGVLASGPPVKQSFRLSP